MEDSKETRLDWISHHSYSNPETSANRSQCNAYAPIASFEDLSDEHDLSLSHTGVPNTSVTGEALSGPVSAMASNETIHMLTESPVSLSISMSGGSQSYSQAETPQTPRIDVVNASSSCSSAHSSDSREFFSSTEDLRHGFLEANYETDLKRSTDDLGGSGPESHRSKAYLYSQVTPNSQLDLVRRKSWDGGRNSASDINRKASSCSTRSADMGRCSRIYRERLGSFNSADSRMNLLPSSQSNRGSTLSVAMLETSFCGSKSSLVNSDDDITAEPRPEPNHFPLEKSCSAASVLQPFLDQHRKPQWKIAPINITESSLSFRRQSQPVSPGPGCKSPLLVETSFCGSRIFVQNDVEEPEHVRRSQLNSPLSRKTSLTVNFDKLPHISYQTEPRSRPASPAPSTFSNHPSLPISKEPLERLLSGSSSVTSNHLHTYAGEETSDAAASFSMDDEDVSTSERHSSSVTSLVQRVPSLHPDSHCSSSEDDSAESSRHEEEREQPFHATWEDSLGDQLLDQEVDEDETDKEDEEADPAHVLLEMSSNEHLLSEPLATESETELLAENGYNGTFATNFSPSTSPTSEVANSSVAGSSEFLDNEMPNGAMHTIDKYAAVTNTMADGISAESLAGKSCSSGDEGTETTPPRSGGKVSKKRFNNPLSALQRAFHKKDKKSSKAALENSLSQSASKEHVQELKKESSHTSLAVSSTLRKMSANGTKDNGSQGDVHPPALVPTEERSFAKQESLDDELPFVPTTLPQERSVIAPMTPIGLRSAYTVSTSPRPRPRPSTALPKTNLEQYLVMINNTAKVDEVTAERRLRLKLPSKVYYPGEGSSVCAQLLRQSTSDSN